jgi:carbamoyl-phosphate synthase large subunit
MSKRTDIKSVLIIGSGAIVVGQACEFDYSGTQGAKVLKDEGYRVILVNSNPATIMTDRDTADKIYLEPLTKESIGDILRKERPDAILATLGGQTALNLALELNTSGILDELNIKLIGVDAEAIEKAENREKFKDLVEDIEVWCDIEKKYKKLKCPKSVSVRTKDEAILAMESIGLPLIIRPSLTLGGSGGGVAKSYDEYVNLVEKGLAESPINQVCVDQDLTGWKEYEFEVVRDKNDNAIIVCSIENIDYMGIHTGDSITVSPAMTLTDKEYQFMRDASISILRSVGVETGGSNVQFALDPKNGDIVVIEMNPRVSRSSALVSKATGFPIAKVATKLAIGYSLDEIKNDIACGIPKEFDYLKFKNVITGKDSDEAIEKYIKQQKDNGITDLQIMQKVLPASFEPSIDYVVIKIPKFNFEKFKITKPLLGIQMQSVGEIMAIGRTFRESFRKAIDSLESYHRFYMDIDLRDRLKINSPSRIFDIFDALRDGYSADEVAKITKYDKWFIKQIYSMVFDEEDGGTKIVYKKIDTCANEFDTDVNYFYSTKENGYRKVGSDEVFYDNEAKAIEDYKVIILGSGANRIGQGLEFDYACVQASKALRSIGIKTIMVNSNPETVSTDYDVSDRLYFEPVTDEYVRQIILNEMDITIDEIKIDEKIFKNLRNAYEYFCKKVLNDDEKSFIRNLLKKYFSVAITFGGQTALNSRHLLEEMFIPVFGNSEFAIEMCDNRETFEKFCKEINILRPQSFVCNDNLTLDLATRSFDYKFIIRPTSVIGGRGMSIINNEYDYRMYLATESGYLPCVVDELLENAREFDVDVLKDKDGNIFIAGILEQLEYAGVHSGDSSAILCDYDFGDNNELIEIILKIVQKLNVIGAINIQIAIGGEKIYVIEVNPRVSRTLPFISKATQSQLVVIATKIMAGKTLKECIGDDGVDCVVKDDYITFSKLKNYYVKKSVFSFEKFIESDILLTPEMKSTGEVIGIGETIEEALIKSFIATGSNIEKKENVIISVRNINDEFFNKIIELLENNDYKILVTDEMQRFLKNKYDIINNVNDMNDVGLIISNNDSPLDFLIRREAIRKKIPHTTNLEVAEILIKSLDKYYKQKQSIK